MTLSTDPQKLWLVCNPSSGSNDDAAVQALVDSFAAVGLAPSRIVRFPDDEAPSPEELDAAGVDLLAIFAGDGTVHSIVLGTYGWNGAVLVLPGGTMNLLAKRMHGDVEAAEIIGRLDGRTPLKRVRPKVVQGREGIGLTGLLAGPGTVWNDVREAMRAASIAEFVSTAREAISYSTNGPRVVCVDVQCGRDEGYVAITAVPNEHGLEAKGYYAESLEDYAGQGIALLSRDFRNGPHDDLGVHQRLHIRCPTGDAMGLLMDGEPHDATAEEIFDLGTCGVDLVCTLDAGLGGADAR